MSVVNKGNKVKKIQKWDIALISGPSMAGARD